MGRMAGAALKAQDLQLFFYKPLGFIHNQVSFILCMTMQRMSCVTSRAGVFPDSYSSHHHLG